MAAPRISPAGQALAFGTVGPLLSGQGQFVAADFSPNLARTALVGRFPQTTRWPLPGSGTLHPLDFITINGVDLPLDSMPSGGREVSLSSREAPGSDNALHVTHGRRQHPTKIVLLLFRDTTLGYAGGTVRGKDWFLEYDKIENTLQPKAVLSRSGAIPVYYPTLHQVGIDSLVFSRVSLPQHKRGGLFTLELEGLDPRTIKDGVSTPVDHVKEVTTKGNPPAKSAPQQGTGGPSSAHRGK